MTAISLVAFHGTSSDFGAFTEQSIGKGAATEPNNRLGVYLTACPSSASDYAMSASGDDESRATVLAVLFEGKLGPSFFSSSEQFVQGDLHDSMEDHAIAQAFRQAHAHAVAQSTEDDGEDGDANYDPCEVFEELRASMRKSFDALWIENGESPHLVVLNPSCLRIVHKLNNDQASELSDAIADSNIYSFGMEDEHKQCLSMLGGLFGPSLDQLTPGVLDSYALHAFKVGACGALAIALHEEMGWPIYAVTDAHNVEDGVAGGGSALHWVVKRPDGLFIDVDGAHTRDALVAEYDGEADEGGCAIGKSTYEDCWEWYGEAQGEPIPIAFAKSFVDAVVMNASSDGHATKIEPPVQAAQVKKPRP